MDRAFSLSIKTNRFIHPISSLTSGAHVRSRSTLSRDSRYGSPRNQSRRRLSRP
jgi:hypothetical protein